MSAKDVTRTINNQKLNQRQSCLPIAIEFLGLLIGIIYVKWVFGAGRWEQFDYSFGVLTNCTLLS